MFFKHLPVFVWNRSILLVSKYKSPNSSFPPTVLHLRREYHHYIQEFAKIQNSTAKEI